MYASSLPHEFRHLPDPELLAIERISGRTERQFQTTRSGLQLSPNWVYKLNDTWLPRCSGPECGEVRGCSPAVRRQGFPFITIPTKNTRRS